MTRMSLLLAALLTAILVSGCSTLDIASHSELQGVKAQVNENRAGIASLKAETQEALASLEGKINRDNRYIFNTICRTSGDGGGTQALLMRRMKAAGKPLADAANNLVTMEQIRILACMGIHSEDDFQEEAYLHRGQVLVEVEAYPHTSGRKVAMMVKSGDGKSVSATITGTRDGRWSVQ